MLPETNSETRAGELLDAYKARVATMRQQAEACEDQSKKSILLFRARKLEDSYRVTYALAQTLNACFQVANELKSKKLDGLAKILEIACISQNKAIKHNPKELLAFSKAIISDLNDLRKKNNKKK